MNWRPVLYCCILQIACCPTAVVSQERPSIEELIKDLESSDREKRRDAAHTLVDYGSGAEQALDALIAALADRDLQIWHDANQAIAHLGPKAAPALDALLLGMDSGDEQRRYRTAFAIGSMGTVALPAMREKLDDKSGNTREVAIRAIGVMGPTAAAATLDLIRRLDDKGEELQLCAVNSLASIGNATVEPLLTALNHEKTTIRSGAARAIAAIGTPAEKTLTKLIECSSSDPEPSVRAAAVAALGRVGPNDPKIIDPLVAALQDKSNIVKRASVEAWIPASPQIQIQATEQLAALLSNDEKSLQLGVLLILNRFGARAASATPVLLEKLSKQPQTEEFASTLGQIGEAALEPTYEALRQEIVKPAQVALIIQGMPSTLKREIAKKTKDTSPIVRELAATTIGELLPFPRDGIELLSTSIADTNESVRAAAAKSIHTIGKKAAAIADNLAQAIEKEQDDDVRAAMLTAFAAAATKSDKLRDTLAGNIKHSSADVRSAALTALSEFDSLPNSLYETLSSLAQEQRPSDRILASLVMPLIKDKQQQTANRLQQLLDDDNAEVQQQAMRSLAKLGDNAKPVLDRIQSLLNAESADLQIAAMESLAALGERANEAVAKFEELSQHESAEVRKSAVQGLRHIASEPKEIVSIFVARLEDEDWGIRRAAARELGELEEVATPAVPALLNMLRNDDDSDDARNALREIGTAGPEAVPVLLDILQDSKTGKRSRYYSLYLLRKMGAKAATALPQLRTLREKSDGRTGEYYDRAINSIEEDLAEEKEEEVEGKEEQKS